MSETTQRKRTVVWKDPTVNARAAEQMSGLEFLGAMQKGELPLPPMCELVGFEPAEVKEGRVVFECTPAECHYNPIGAVHGGLACTLFDSAMGCAVHTMHPAGVGYTTVELKVDFLRPITLKTGGFCARALPSTSVVTSLPPRHDSSTRAASSMATPPLPA